MTKGENGTRAIEAMDPVRIGVDFTLRGLKSSSERGSFFSGVAVYLVVLLFMDKDLGLPSTGCGVMEGVGMPVVLMEVGKPVVLMEVGRPIVLMWEVGRQVVLRDRSDSGKCGPDAESTGDRYNPGIVAE